MPEIPNEAEFGFTLVLDGINELTEESIEAFGEAGCDDSTPSLRSGRVYLTFARFAPSMYDAVVSAIRDVRASGIGADVLRVDSCNLVTQAEIARKLGHSRQYVHQLITGVRGPGTFPGPACELGENTPLYYWCEVAYWLWEHGHVEERMALEAEEIAAINSWLELQYHERHGRVRTEDFCKSLGATKAMQEYSGPE